MIPRAIQSLLKSQQEGGSVRIWKGGHAVRRVAQASDFGDGTKLDGGRGVFQEPAQRESHGHL